MAMKAVTFPSNGSVPKKITKTVQSQCQGIFLTVGMFGAHP